MPMETGMNTVQFIFTDVLKRSMAS